ncbi:hypothetical protein [Candidatus Enterococcus mangumiae]|uniref:Uncharacterized protein n=1 Tax=Candidatus Enterococcus mangumiae TaxID=2230878 RepID=A0ABZ2SW87_9ENTE|nr:hypothetical protein [Enterococcus sp. DIV1094]MBO0488929.1 hypothetical protein [Enterococcus sp. DIV1094]
MNDEKILGVQLSNSEGVTKEGEPPISEYLIARQFQPTRVREGLESEKNFKETIKQYRRENRFMTLKKSGRLFKLLLKTTSRIILGRRLYDKITLNKTQKDQVVTTNNKEQRSKQGNSQGKSAQHLQMKETRISEVGDSLHSPKTTQINEKPFSTTVKGSPLFLTRKLSSAYEAAKIVNTPLSKGGNNTVSKERS